MRDEEYFRRLEADLAEAREVAERARRQGRDPETEVEIPQARDMADRVEKVLGIDGVADRVRELEGEMSREEAALALVEDFVEGSVGDFETRAGKIEGAVRTAVALLTEGVVAAPIEGIDRVELLANDDGTEFVNIYYAGPIRSAGGTAQALSVLVADYARSLLGLDEYRARDTEVERYAEEVALYDDDTGLQYSPKDKETKHIARNMPVMLDGEATGDEEVSGYRDLERVDTNNPRGGMCLVLAEGIALKAPKIRRYTRDLEEVAWPWLQDLIDGTVGENPDDDAGDDAGDDAHAADDGPPRAEPSEKYLRDLIAGRPVFGHPSESGGFRLRYGRARNHGHATAGVHPATMRLVDDFLAPGTQLKTERPGKAAGVVPVDSIEGPTVRLANGDVRRIDDPEEAMAVRNGVEAVLDLGEYLVNYGEFVENNHPLVPASYTPEWWVQEFEAAGADVVALEDDPTVDLEHPAVDRALSWAREYDAPLHPEYTYLWHDVSVEQFLALARAVDDAPVENDRLLLPGTDDVRDALERLLVEHHQGDRIEVGTWRPLVASLGVAVEGADASDGRDVVGDGGACPADPADGPRLEREWTVEDLPERAREAESAVRAVNAVAPFRVRERAPTRVGNRMGRPEKSEQRELSPAVHALFPIGDAGGDQRDIAAAAEHAPDRRSTPGLVEVDVGRRVCPDCGRETHESRCECGAHTEPRYECPDCGRAVEPDEAGRVRCPRCDVAASAVEPRELDVHGAYREALETVGERESAFDVLKGVKGLTSTIKTPEPVAKGVLRSKHGVSAFKDGTVRYDMTDLPVTAVRPAELDVDPEQLRELGYETDVHGDPLRHDDQLVELKVQDVVLSDGAAEHMLQTADFVDDLLTQFYDLEPFYELEDRDDLVGELVFGMAPHTSAAVVARVVGFTSAAVGYGHPYFHASKRRNCFHPDTKLWYSEDGEWHHERIEDFVEDRLDEERADRDDFGAFVQAVDEEEVFVRSVDDAGRVEPKPVEAVSMHPAQDHLVEVETDDGRELTVTPDHGMLRWAADGGLERVEAMDLSVGDEVPLGDSPSVAMRSTAESPVPLTDGGPGENDGRAGASRVESVEIVSATVEHTYCLTVDDNNTVEVDGLFAGQCDGDEDCVMLLMDGLLNFSKTYLPDQRGGSVTADSTLVAHDPDGDVRFLTFGEFWDELDSDVVRDGRFEKKLVASEGWETYAFSGDHRSEPKPIERAIRYEAGPDEEVLRIETQFGRSVEITTDHSLFRYDDGIEEIAGADLSEGDLVVAPRSLDVEPVETTIDVADCLDDSYVVIDDRVEDLLRTVWESTARGGETHAAFSSGLSYRLSKEKVSLDRLEQIVDAAPGVEEVPNDIEIAREGASNGVTRTVPVNEEFAWLLGVFTAEGTLSSVNPCLHNADEELVDRVVEVVRETLGHDPETRWSNRAYEVRFPTVFEDVLHELGFADLESYSSSEKVVPEAILRADRETVLAYLRGFLAGDGSRSSDGNVTTVAFYTTSEPVKDGVVFLLHRLGLVANVSLRDRDPSRQSIYTVTVSGGAEENPLERLFDGEESYLPKSLVVTIPEALMEIRESGVADVKQVIPKYLTRRENVSLEKLREMYAELSRRDLPEDLSAQLDEIQPLVEGDLSYLRVQTVERVEYEGHLYDLQVGGDPVFTANWLYAHNSMDAPLVMTSRIDPTEIDDEAHNIDVVSEYPLELYEASREMARPEEVDVTIAEDKLGTENATSGFGHTHDTADIAAGPDLSAYKTLGDMSEKMDAQLELARTLRAVDETDVAERIIEYHFLPDLIGNLRAFSQQEVRCLDCGKKYRRPPLSEDCQECGGDVTLTVHEGSVTKYLETASRVAEEYGARTYTKQRIEVLERSIGSVFENDKNKATSLADFMGE